MRNLRELEPFAQANHGLVTIRAAKRAGISSSSWYRALDSGPLVPVHPGVARLIGSEVTAYQMIAAAVLAAGPGAMASHRSAARLWGVPRPPEDPIDLILCDRSREANLDGVITHRPRDQRDLSPVRRRNISCSNVYRWTCDLGAVDEPGLHAAVGHVLFAGYATLHDLTAAAHMHSRQGRAGVPALRAALADWALDGKPIDSILEQAMRDLVARFDLPPVEFHAIVHGYEVDFLVIDTPIILECDGWGTHGRIRRNFERDRVRDAELTGWGYITVRFTYRKLTNDPQWVASKIRGALDRWRDR